MDRSTNYNFYLPSRDADDIADINQISDNFRTVDTKMKNIEDTADTADELANTVQEAVESLPVESGEGLFSVVQKNSGAQAAGESSAAFGLSSNASGRASHAEGWNTVASDLAAHAEGIGTTASNKAAHAEGNGTEASGAASHAEGYGTKAQGAATHAEGQQTIATDKVLHVEGKFNDVDGLDAEKTYLHACGNGTSDSDRSNAYLLDDQGNAWYSGEVYTGADKQRLISESDIDQTYNPESQNAQSGTAVAEAVAPIETKADMLELSSGSGKAVAVTDSAAGKIIGLSVYGESLQDGTPSPEAPVEIVSVENPAVEVYAKNILPYPYDQTTHESAGVTFTDNGDGSITANGTSTDWAVYNLASNFTMKAGTYYTAGTASDRISIIAYDGSEWTTFAGHNVKQFTLTEDKVFQFVKVQLSSGFAYSDVQILPYISVTPYTEYTPYTAPQTVTIPCTLRGIKGSDGSWSARDEIVVDGKQKTVQLVRRVVQAVLDGSADEHYQCNNIPNVAHLFTCFNYGTTSYFDNIQHTFTQRDLGLCETYVLSGQPLAQSPDKSFRATDAIYFINQDVEESVEAWRAYLAEHPITCYLALAEPEVTDITDTEAGQALLALVTHYPNTTVVCDADCALRYKADTTIAYNNLLSRVAALEAAAVGQM